jgi:hypothetical protein
VKSIALLLLLLAPQDVDVPGQRVFVCGHSFHTYVAKPLEALAASAGISGHVNAGTQFIGGSSVTQHWDLADEKNSCKKTLAGGKVDVLTLSPNWVMPDPAIGRFTELALKGNPNTRVLIQMSWPAFDAATRSGGIKKNEERDQKPVQDIASIIEAARPVFDKQIQDVNEKAGKTVAYGVPVCYAVLALREKVVQGKAPGIAKQSELFRDPLGHGQEPIQRLAEYCYFAAIYRRSPVGLTAFAKEGDPLDRLLQELAWEAVTSYPLSGLKK